MGPPPVHRGFFHQWGWKKAGMAARKAEGKRRGHRVAVPPARPMRRHRPREGGKRSIGRERLPDSHVPPSPIPWKRARNQPGMYFVGNGRKIAHVANGVIRTGKNDSGSSPRMCVEGSSSRGASAQESGVFPTHVWLMFKAKDTLERVATYLERQYNGILLFRERGGGVLQK